jgi:hypothetical protein
MAGKKSSSLEKTLFYSSTGALVAVAMLIPFAVVAAAQEIFEIGDLWSVLCFLIVGLLIARVVSFLLVPRRPMP